MQSTAIVGMRNFEWQVIKYCNECNDEGDKGNCKTLNVECICFNLRV